MQESIKEKLRKIPHKPGCYLWKDKNGIVIYVGKAVDLANRTKQYFLKDRDLKTRKLVKEIADLDYVVVNNENESLLLENNLISEYKPKYNMLLRESNTFPYIVITKEEHPRILYSHDSKKKIKGTYYCPFASSN
ncbi:MAG: GIY-YIG nuclease family protein, partial [Malacoplasma sp.]|nr:GIY-YIG nuclease family protein [Malacoplasma sp.]